MKKHWSSKTWLDWYKMRRLLGAYVVGVALTFSFVSVPTHAFDYQANTMPDAELTKVVTTTSNQYTFPLENTLGMSQGFGGLHTGVDLRAPVGTKVFAMAEGVIIEVKRIWGGYGHFVRIAHDGTVSSLYAHLDQVKVESGQKVYKGQEIGTVGMTGWTTGPHLHFEVYEGERLVNPLRYIAENHNIQASR